VKKRWRKQRDRVRALADEWVRPLGLCWWNRVEFHYYTGKKECERLFGRGDDAQAIMITYADWRYLEARVKVNLRALEAIDGDMLEQYILHELMHLFLDEASEGKRHIERACTRLAQAFGWVRDKYEPQCK
jgi:hypothetical protein